MKLKKLLANNSLNIIHKKKQTGLKTQEIKLSQQFFILITSNFIIKLSNRKKFIVKRL